MPLVDITNPYVIKFLAESYDKTARLRMKWNNLHGDKLKQAATLQREEKGYYETDVLKAAMAAGMPTITRDHKSGTRNRRLSPIRDGIQIPTSKDFKKGHSIVDVGLGDPKIDPRLIRPDFDLRTDLMMRPINPEHKKILYKDIPKFGRNAYLKIRNKIKPEDKYYFNPCSEWEYGWRLGDSYFSKTAPQYGRVWRLSHDVKSRSGPQPDPEHYNGNDIAGYQKCEI